MAKTAQPVLLADIGGTNARFALACEGELRQTARFLVADYPGPVEAIRDFLNEARPETEPRRAVLAFAGPVAQGRAQLTNGSWRVSASGLRRLLGMASVSLVNDFAALAWALPELGARDAVALGGGKAVRGAPAIVIGQRAMWSRTCGVNALPRNTPRIVTNAERILIGSFKSLPAMDAAVVNTIAPSIHASGSRK